MNEKPIVCFLRGINVSGKNMIKMTDLSAVFKGLGFTNVSTYLQSGNVVFSNNKGLKESDLRELITTRIRKKSGLDVPVLVRSKDEIDSILMNNKFLNKENADIEKLYVTMLEECPEESKIDNLKLSDFSPERFDISGREVYIFCPDGYGRAKLNNNLQERKLGSTATTRNWKTMVAISRMMGSTG